MNENMSVNDKMDSRNTKTPVVVKILIVILVLGMLWLILTYLNVIDVSNKLLNKDVEDNLDTFEFEYKDKELPKNLISGDVNQDGKVDIIDSRWLLQYLEGSRTLTEEQKIASDVNLDGKIDKFDLTLLLKNVSGSVKELPSKLILGDINQDRKVDIVDTK